MTETGTVKIVADLRKNRTNLRVPLQECFNFSGKLKFKEGRTIKSISTEGIACARIPWPSIVKKELHMDQQIYIQSHLGARNCLLGVSTDLMKMC